MTLLSAPATLECTADAEQGQPPCIKHGDLSDAIHVGIVSAETISIAGLFGKSRCLPNMGHDNAHIHQN